MDLAPAFERCRKLIEASLEGFLEAKGRELAGVNRWGPDLAERLLRFSLNGKMIRGGLVILAHGMFGEAGGSFSDSAGFQDPPPWVVEVAAAYELIHSSLLVHDDIMDRDRVRRGKPAMFHQYEELGKNEGATEPLHFGTSLGICAGDAGFFLAFEMLSGLTSAPGTGGTESRIGSASAAPPERAWKILGLWAKELTAVGLAQMEDVALGASSRTGGEKEILNLYRYKTARYTFSIPLATGAIAAGSGPETVSRLEELGEDLGILFQMKDDEIGIFGEEAEIGKPPGSDIEEGKQTLIARVLSERGGGEYANIAARMRRRSADRSRGRSNDRPGESSGGAAGGLPGVPPANLPGARSDLASLRALAEETGVLGSLERIREPIRVRAEELIESLGVRSGHKSFLRELLRYNFERRR